MGHVQLLESDAGLSLFDVELECSLVAAPDSESSWKIPGPELSSQDVPSHFRTSIQTVGCPALFF